MAFIYSPPDLEQTQRVGVTDAVIVTQGATKQFGNEVAVQNLTFQIPRGAVFGFIGPSGSGKTTTVRMLTGVYEPSSGEVFVLGEKPTKFNQRQRAQVGYMPQLFVLYPNLTVWENLNFAASIYGMGFFRRRRLMNILEFVELTDHRDKLARSISGGMQRRLSLAATLIHNPKLIFLDEPTAGIDPVLRRKFWDHFKELQNEGRTLFITTQYVSEAVYCDLVGMMVEGKLIAVDTPTNLRRRAYHGDVVEMHTAQPLDYKQEYALRQLNFISGDIKHTGQKDYRLTVNDAAAAMPEIMVWSRANNIDVETIEEYQPPFEDVFVELVREAGNGQSV